MEAREKKKILIYGGLVVVVTAVYLILTASNAGAAPAGTDTSAPSTGTDPVTDPVTNQPAQQQNQNNAQASQEFDNYINQARAYANKQSSITKGIMQAAIGFAAGQKTTIINEALSKGQSITDSLASKLPVKF